MAAARPTRTHNAQPTEEAIDEAVDESFPASDPPSFTPISSLGPPPDEDAIQGMVDMEDRGWGRMALKLGAAALACAAVAWAIYSGAKRKKQRERRLSHRLAAAGATVSAALSPAMEAAREHVRPIDLAGVAGERLHAAELAKGGRRKLRVVRDAARRAA